MKYIFKPILNIIGYLLQIVLGILLTIIWSISTLIMFILYTVYYFLWELKLKRFEIDSFKPDYSESITYSLLWSSRHCSYCSYFHAIWDIQQDSIINHIQKKLKLTN